MQTTYMKELWRNIDGYKGVYQVSSLGRIRSFKNKETRILKQRINSRGYLYINLSENAKYKSYTVHRLVAIAFLGKSNLTVNHKNGNKLNNTIENLEWITDLDNRKHAKENNLTAKGERNGRHKLTLFSVKLLRYKYKNGKSIRSLSREFNISRSVITKIVNNISWN